MVWIPFRQLAALALVMMMARSLMPCPFCSALSSTLSEEIKQSHWAFLATCLEPAEIHDDAKPPIHRFALKSRLKLPYAPIEALPPAQAEGADGFQVKSLVFERAGAEAARGTSSFETATALACPVSLRVSEGDVVEVYSLQPYKKGQVVLLLGNSINEITDWTGSEPLSESAQDYLRQLVSLPEAAEHNRLRFFLPALQSSDKLIATDAYNEFALASLSAMNDLKAHLKVQEVIAVIENPLTKSDLRRLYWTLLGICGSSSDLEVVERAMQANLAKGQGDIGMDAVFSCYLVLGGQQALEKLEQQYLQNPASSFTNCFALLGALRVHAEQIRVIEPPRICQSFRLALTRRNLAELVIPDLARWQDWTVIDQLVELFGSQADGEKQPYKIPIINYLRSCPLPEARVALAKCEQIDPDAVRRTTLLFPSR